MLAINEDGIPTQTAGNLLVGESVAQTATNVRNVLKFLAVVQPTDSEALNSDEEMGRFLILQSCVEALGTIEGVA